MKEQILTLEADDDLHSLRDKILRVQAGRILLRWAALKAPIRRRLDIALMERWAAGIGSSLAVVSPDPAVRRLCRRAGVEAYADLTIASSAPAPAPRKSRAVPRRSPQRLSSPPPRQTDRNISLAGRLAIFSAAILSIILAGLLIVPSATVDAAFPARRIQANAPFPQSECTPIQSALESSGRATTTGRILADTAFAEGAVNLTNISGRPLSVPAGIYIKTQDGTRFLTLSGLILQSGGTVSVPLRATKAGEDGNVQAGAIDTVEGSLGQFLEANNPAPTTGGVTEWRNEVSQADVERLRQTLIAQIEAETPERIAALVGDGNSLVTGSTATNYGPEAQPDFAVHSAADTVGLKISATVSALVCPADQMAKQADTMLSALITPDETLFPASIQFQARMDPGGKVILFADGQAFTPPDPQAVLFAIRGRTPDQADHNLQSQFGAGGPIIISQAPDWIPWLPIFPFRIRFLSEPEGNAG